MKQIAEEIKNCSKCGLARTRTNAVCGEGDPDARLMLIGQAPGENEDRQGRMFTGAAGRVLDELLDAAGITRSDLYMTNLVKCTPPGNRPPARDEVEACLPYLEKEIEAVNPGILVPLGFLAASRLFLQDGLDPPADGKFSGVCGRLFWSGQKKLFPVYHPAAALHNPALKADLLRNFRRIPVLLTNCKWFRLCPMRRFYRANKLDPSWIELYCKGDWQSCVRYQMEEAGKPHPDTMLPDGSIDHTLER
ncbi:MAG: uracil-DNA glycosylase [Desulfosalsimonadaceae bacterium]